MTWSSRPSVHAARDIDAMLEAEWALDDLFTPSTPGAAFGAPSTPDPAEQDALVEAMAAANAELERRHAEALQHAAAEAYARGYEDGRRAGEEGEAARLHGAAAALAQALEEVSASATRWTDAAEENIAALAVAVARHLVGRELHADRETIADLVRRALTEFPIDQPVRIRVNPMDLAVLSATPAADGRPITGSRDASWQADPLLAPGGCIVEGRDRIIDGRVDAALERLYRRLTYTTA